MPAEPMPAKTYAPELISRMLELRALGWTCGKIAKEIGVTRSAVLGKLRRLKLGPAKIGIRPAARPRTVNILPGQQYGRLTAIEFVPIRGHGQRWKFLCKCGNEVVRRASQVKRGEIRSCGCLRRTNNFGNRKPGRQRDDGSRYGDGSRRQSPEYNSWCAMKARCTNPKQPGWRWYGGRGIRVCDRWLKSFDAFLADMGPRPSPEHVISLIDRLGNYEPGNCRWALKAEQMAIAGGRPWSDEQRQRFSEMRRQAWMRKKQAAEQKAIALNQQITANVTD
jgi:hypothetical protein